jgi:hypothetical protein
MNIKLFTDDDTRENVLKHVRGGNSICYEPPIHTVEDERCCMVTPSVVCMDNHLSNTLFEPTNTPQSLSPQHNNNYRSEYFAEDLVEGIE